MAVSTGIKQVAGNNVRSSMVEYGADNVALLAEGSTIGLTVQTLLNGVEVVAGAAYLQTVPAGGQTPYAALNALAALIDAGAGTKSAVSENTEDFQLVLNVEPQHARAGGGGANEVVVSTPVFVAA